MNRTLFRRLGHLLGAGGAAVAALIWLAPAAAAHVAVDSASPNGDGTTTVTLVWDHSCTPETSTSGVTVSAGPGVEFTGATSDLPGWSATVDPSTVAFSGPGVCRPLPIRDCLSPGRHAPAPRAPGRWRWR